MTTFFQDPDDDELYLFQHSTWLQEGETITVHEVTPDDGIDATGEVVTAANDIAVSLSGGVHGSTYEVRCHVETSAGRKKDKSIYLTIWSTSAEIAPGELPEVLVLDGGEP